MSAILAQGQSHVFSSASRVAWGYAYPPRRIRHVYPVGGTFEAVDLSDNGTCVVADALSASEHQDHWALSVLVPETKNRPDVFYGQGGTVCGVARQTVHPRTGPPSISSYSAYGLLNVLTATREADQWS